MTDAPAFIFSARQRRGDLPCVDPELLRKIAVARYGEGPQWTGPGAAAICQHRMGQVQLMLDAIISVVPGVEAVLPGLSGVPQESRDCVRYAVELERKLAQANLIIAIIHQAARDHLDEKERSDG